MTPTLRGALWHACDFLKSLDTSRLDAEILLSYLLKKNRSYLLAWPEASLTSEQVTAFHQLLTRRLQGEPVAHIVGEKEFWSLPLEVTPNTLIPRPDTELLVELILKKLPETEQQTVADLGTGSGAIALAIATERPQWEIIATDNYPETLAVAKRNAKKLGLTNIHFYQGDWCAALPPNSLHAIVSNPPYIAENDPHLASAELSFEPPQALVSGKAGLDALTCIIQQAAAHLAPGGWLLLEHGFDQAPAVAQRMQAAGYQDVVTYHDLAKHPRVTSGRRAAE